MRHIKRDIKPSNASSDSKWGVIGGDSYYPVEQSADIIPSGLYTFVYHQDYGTIMKHLNINNDELLILPDSVSKFIIDEIDEFWNKEDKFNDFNFLWKRGVMLFGPPGSGKTATINIVIDNIIKDGGLAFYVNDPYYAKEGLISLRKIEPDRKIVVIFEDLDSIIAEHGDGSILPLLDGELQINKAIFIATTNYPETLDKRIKNRPSRFDIVKYIDYPSSAARKMFLEHKNPRLKEDSKELDKWVKTTEKMSIAHIKEIIILVEVFGKTFEEAIQRMKEMSDTISSDKFETGGASMGFT